MLYQPIKNQSLIEGGYIRYLVINQITKRPQPVVRSDSSPNCNAAGTYQKVTDGNLLIISTIKVDELGNLSIKQEYNSISVKEDRMYFDELPVGFNMHVFTTNMNDAVSNWLDDPDSRPSLPAGIGWDGKYSESELEKRRVALEKLPKDIPEDLRTRFEKAIDQTRRWIIMNTKPPMNRELCPTFKIDKRSTDLYIEVYEDKSVVRDNLFLATDEERFIDVPVGVKEIILIKFIPLKTPGHEKFEWHILKYF